MRAERESESVRKDAEWIDDPRRARRRIRVALGQDRAIS